MPFGLLVIFFAEPEPKAGELIVYQSSRRTSIGTESNYKTTTGLILLKLLMKYQRPKPCIFLCSNFEPGLILTSFIAGTNIAT